MRNEQKILLVLAVLACAAACGCKRAMSAEQVEAIEGAVVIADLEKMPTDKQTMLPECGPCVVKAVLGYYGDTDGIGRFQLWKELETGLESGTFAKQIVALAGKRGYRTSLFSGTLEALEKSIAADEPFIVGVYISPNTFRLYPHFYVVVGYTERGENGRRIFVYDSSRGGFFALPIEEFLLRWDFFSTQIDLIEDELELMELKYPEPDRMSDVARERYEKLEDLLEEAMLRRSQSLNLMLVIHRK